MDKYAKVAEALQDAEIAVLKAFRKTKADSMHELKGMKQVEFLRAAMWLENKGLIKSKKSISKVLVLDELGRRYMKGKLPEMRMIALLMKKSYPLSVLKKQLSQDEYQFALGYLRKKGYIDLKNGIVSLNQRGRNLKLTLEGALLAKLAKKGEMPVEALTDEERYAYLELLKRKQIIRVVEKKRISLHITELGKKVGENLPTGIRIHNLTPDIIKNQSWKGKKFRRFDVEAQVPRMNPGKKQAYMAFLDDVREILTDLGFEEMTGPPVESCFYNCDALFIPQNHPARGIHDIYYLKHPKRANLKKVDKYVNAVKATHETGGKTGSTGWQLKFDKKESERQVLRSHGTAISARTLMRKDLKIPGKYFAIARVYRPDVIDSTHLSEFNHMEGIILDKDMNFKKLLGMLKTFAERITGYKGIKIKFLPGYFPFTEPSIEAYLYLPSIKQWIEVMPAGIFRAELTKPLGIDVPVLAWGIGVDRLFMIREHIKDIRYLFSSDLKWLREAKL